MSQPYLIIVAGCNGSGKSTFSKTFVQDLIPFDYDKTFLSIYNSMSDSELREKIARNKTTEKFESAINSAFSNRENFCYETNFDNFPVYWAEKAQSLGYHIELHFYCLDSIALAIKRVSNRVRHKGHPVYDEVVTYKWREGYKNLNIHYTLFDFILLIENSSSQRPLQNLFSLTKIKDDYEIEFYTDEIPVYMEKRLPEIYHNYLQPYLEES